MWGERGCVMGLMIIYSPHTKEGQKPELDGVVKDLWRVQSELDTEVIPLWTEKNA